MNIMKLFETLTEQELIALTESQIERYIDYACAENGVPLLPSLLQPPLPVSYEPNAKIYTLGYQWHFATAEDAARVMEAIKASRPIEVDYLSTPTGVTSHGLSARRANLPGITIDDAFSAERAAELKQELINAKLAEDTYEKAKKVYDQAVASRQSCVDDIQEAVGLARDVHRTREARRASYERYLDLANGDREIATRFLINAHSDVRELLPELFELAEAG